MMNRILPVYLLAGFFVAALSLKSVALSYDIALYRMEDLKEKGISVTIQETSSGKLKCKVACNIDQMGSPIWSVRLSSTTPQASIDMELRPREHEDNLVFNFSLSRDLLMHAQLTIGINNKIPGGTFYHVAFVDIVDFGKRLSPKLQQRRDRLVAMGLVGHGDMENLEERLERFNDSTPMRGEGGNVKDFSKLERRIPKIKVVPFALPTPNPNMEGGAEQTATAPESKLEGEKKPKPESEGRSR